jgi:hypothetical protein
MKIIRSIIVLSTSLFMLISCNENVKKEENKEVSNATENVDKIPVKDSSNYCFIKALNKDTTTVTLTIENNKVSGTMEIKPYQKDRSTGLLSGVKNEAGELDLLYNYMQEGMKQTQTVIMKIKDEQLLLKKGELVDAKNDGNLSYKDASKASFSETLEKTSCK